MTDYKTSCRDLNELDPVFKLAVEELLRQCKAAGLNVLITETYRSQERQNYLYCQGRTYDECIKAGINKDFARNNARTGSKVTWTLNSNHKNRRAIDFCKNVKGQEYSDKEFFKKVGQIAKGLGLTWGGDWQQCDTPHIQLDAGKKPIMPNQTQDNKQDKELIEAVQILHKAGIIQSPEVWEIAGPTQSKMNFIDDLIKKIATYLSK